MSPRAAWRLESLGFTKVFDYVAGKADWAAMGLPLEGTRGSATRAGAFVRTDVPTCSLHERLPELRERARAAGWDTCLVVNEERIVLGRIGRAALAGGEDVSVEEAMTPGPGTIRPDVELQTIVQRMRDRNLTSALVTTSDGRLVGLLVRDEAERALADAGR